MRTRAAQAARWTGANENFLNAPYAIEQFVGPCLEGLGAKAGPLVMQLSPLGSDWLRRVPALIERLHAFLSALRRTAPRALLALEVRDRESAERAARGRAQRHRHALLLRRPRALTLDERASRCPCRSSAGYTLVARWLLHSNIDYEVAKTRYAPFDRLIDEDLLTRQGDRRPGTAHPYCGARSFHHHRQQSRRQRPAQRGQARAAHCRKRR